MTPLLLKRIETNEIFNLGKIRDKSISKVKGDYICFLDVDDLWENNKIELQLEKFESNNLLDVVSSNYKILNQGKLIKCDNKTVKQYSQRNLIHSYINGKPLTSWLTLMIKKKTINKLNYSFDKNLHIASDFDLIIRLTDFANFYFIDKYLCTYRLHKNNESNNKKKEISELFYILKKYEKNETLAKIFLYKLFSIKIKIKYYIHKLYF